MFWMETPHRYSDAPGRHGAMTAEQVSGLIDAFTAEHVGKRCKSQTAEAHKIALRRLRGAHGNIKAEALTRNQVAALHPKFKDTPSAAKHWSG